MKKILINATQQEEIRTAIIDGQKLIDFDVEINAKQRNKGNIYKATITRIEPSLNAAFVDYGSERHGFLPFKEISKSYFKKNPGGGNANIAQCLNEGQQVIIQIRREERGNKGAALTTFISLAGRRLILMPDNPRSGGVSRHISGKDREDLQDIISQLKLKKDESVIIRTAGVGQSIAEFQWDLDYLHELWQNIVDAAKGKSAPFLIYQEHDVVLRTLRDYLNDEISEVIIDNKDTLELAEEFVESIIPDQLDKLNLYDNDIPLFSYYQVESEIETAYEREIRLPSGATIVFDHTEALLAIDINSSRSTRGSDIEETALKTNLEACKEIARQLRLRDVGGLIVIDFIDMWSQSNQREIENELRASMAIDRARVQISSISRFGLMEISRQRLRSSLGDVSYIPCPRCSGHGSIRSLESSAFATMRMMEEEAAKQQTGLVVAHLPVDVTSFLLNEKRSNITNLEKLYQVKITIVPDIQMETPHFKINRYRKDDKASNQKGSHEWIQIRDQSNGTELFKHNKEVSTDSEVPAIKSSTKSKIKKRSGDSLLTFLKGLFQSPPEEQVQEKARRRSRSRYPKGRGRTQRHRSQRGFQQRAQSNAQSNAQGGSRSQSQESSGRQRNRSRNRNSRRSRKPWPQQEQSDNAGNRRSAKQQAKYYDEETREPSYREVENFFSEPKQTQEDNPFAEQNSEQSSGQASSRQFEHSAEISEAKQSREDDQQTWFKPYSDDAESNFSSAPKETAAQKSETDENKKSDSPKEKTSVLKEFPMPSDIVQIETKRD